MPGETQVAVGVVVRADAATRVFGRADAVTEEPDDLQAATEVYDNIETTTTISGVAQADTGVHRDETDALPSPPDPEEVKYE